MGEIPKIVEGIKEKMENKWEKGRNEWEMGGIMRKGKPMLTDSYPWKLLSSSTVILATFIQESSLPALMAIALIMLSACLGISYLSAPSQIPIVTLRENLPSVL